MKKSVIVVLVLLLFVTAAVVAVGSKEGGGKAEEPKVLRLITWTGYAPPELIDKFKEETGITVEVTFSNNEEIMSKLRATRGGGFDLAQPSQDRITAVQEEFGIYQPIDWSRVDEDKIEPNMLKTVKEFTMVDGESYGVPAVYGTSGLCVNTARAPDVKDYKDLHNPKYAGRITYRMRRPSLCAMGISYGFDPFGLYSDLDAYQEYLNELEKILIENKPVVKFYYENADALIAAMQSEEVWASMAWEQVSWKLHEMNPDIDYIAPTSGPMAWIDTFAIPSKSENLEGAYKWINFFLTPENAAVFTNKEKFGTGSKDAVKYYDPFIKDMFERCFPPEVMANMNWYPTIPPGIEDMEAKTLERIKMAK
jgi:spermidine/putrescine transport system substrate-binding protein